jgi:CheY-like chemotaxis protein
VVAASAIPHTTVLLVEDTDYNAWAASAVLARLGLSCERARTGEEALRLFAEGRFSIVLLDRNLPDIDGTEVARRMRELESDASRAVLLAVTAYCTAEDRQRCLDAGMDAFLGKPLTPEKLRKAFLSEGRRLLATTTLQASTESEPETPAENMNLELLKYLSNEADGGLARQVQRFLEHLAENETELRSALASRDFARTVPAAHRFVGQARMIGAAAVADAALALEEAAKTRDIPACEAQFETLRRELAALREAMLHRLPAGHSA